jgi:Protein of unknown function (DUF2586)
MTIPYVRETVTDGALATASDDPSNVVAILGHSTLGTAHTLYSLTSPELVRASLGRGKLAEQVANVLVASKGKATVLAMPMTATAGSLGSVTKTAAGSKDGVVANNSSAPVDDYDLVIRITTGGAIATALFVYSLDGGLTFTGRPIATAATVDLGTSGISVAFTSVATGFDAGDLFSAHAFGPTVDHTEVATALDALLADERRWKIVHVLGFPAGASAAARATEAAAIAGALDTKLSTGAGVSRYARGFVDAAGVHGSSDVSDSAIAGAFTETLLRTGVGAGFCLLTGALDADIQKRPSTWPVVARLAASPIHENPGRVKSGPLERVGRLKSRATDPIAWSFHNEATATTPLDSVGFITLRTHVGKAGVYATRGTMMVPPTSDYREVQRGLVMDRACTVGHDGMLDELNDTVRVNKKTGFIDERDAQAIERRVLALEESALTSPEEDGTGAHASAVSFVITRNLDMLSTKLLKYRVRVIPLGELQFIEGDFGFVNPFLSSVA